MRTKDAGEEYFPCRYLRRQVVAWMLHHRQYMMAKRGKAFRARYGAEGQERKSYQQLCWELLDRTTWGEDEILTAVSKMWGLRITCLYSTTLSEVRYRHNLPLDKVDMVVVFNCRNHYVGAGKNLQLDRTVLKMRPQCIKRDGP